MARLLDNITRDCVVCSSNHHVHLLCCSIMLPAHCESRYIEKHRGAPAAAPGVVAETARFIGDTLGMLGMQGFDVDSAGITKWSGIRDTPSSGSGGGTAGKSEDNPVAVAAVDELVQFRGRIRSLALAAVRSATKGSPEHTLAIDLLRSCDDVRYALAALRPHVVVRDLPDGGASWHVE